MALLQLDDLMAPKVERRQEPRNLVEVTPSAVQRVRTMLSGRPELEGKGLRLYVANGGCAGYTYGMEFGEAREGDTTIDCDGLAVVIDRDSVTWLKGVRVDYQDSMLGSGFSITNPNAAASCGCGTSFSKAETGSADNGH